MDKVWIFDANRPLPVPMLGQVSPVGLDRAGTLQNLAKMRVLGFRAVVGLSLNQDGPKMGSRWFKMR